MEYQAIPRPHRPTKAADRADKAEGKVGQAGKGSESPSSQAIHEQEEEIMMYRCLLLYIVVNCKCIDPVHSVFFQVTKPSNMPC